MRLKYEIISHSESCECIFRVGIVTYYDMEYWIICHPAIHKVTYCDIQYGCIILHNMWYFSWSRYDHPTPQWFRTPSPQIILWLHTDQSVTPCVYHEQDIQCTNCCTDHDSPAWLTVYIGNASLNDWCSETSCARNHQTDRAAISRPRRTAKITWLQ